MSTWPGFDADLAALQLFYGGPDGAWSTLMTGLTIVGDGWTAFLLVPLLWSARTRPFAAPLAVTLAAQSVAVWALKAIVGRTRPWIALGLPAPFRTPHDHSFPSGHAAGSFCVAAFLAIALPAIWPAAPRRVQLATAAAFVAAALISSSRVYLGAHFPSDVLAGGVLGAGFGVMGGVRYARGAKGRG